MSKKEKMYELICEWDIGQGDLLFKSSKDAMNWAKTNENLKEVCESEGFTFQDCVDDGLVQTNARSIQ